MHGPYVSEKLLKVGRVENYSDAILYTDLLISAMVAVLVAWLNT